MYIDPKVYNYEGLIEDDKKRIDGFDAAIEEISEGCDECIIEQLCADHEDFDSIARQMKREIVKAAFQILYQILTDRRQNIIVSMIDGYDDE